MIQLKDCYDDQHIYFDCSLTFLLKNTLNCEVFFYASFTLLKYDDDLFLERVRRLAVFQILLPGVVDGIKRSSLNIPGFILKLTKNFSLFYSNTSPCLPVHKPST